MESDGFMSKIIEKIIALDKFKYYAFMVSMLVFGLTLIRAVVVSLTYDEADTYLHYVRFRGIFGFLIKDIANNHPLNTLLIFITTTLTKIQFNEFIIRLPNVCAFLVYLFLAYKISAAQKYRIFLFSILAFNPYLNEFFGLARGYGLAAAFTLAALLAYTSVPRTNKNIIVAAYLFTMASFSIASGLVLFASFFIYAILFDIGVRNLAQFIRKNILHLILLFAINAYLAYNFIIVSNQDPNLVGNYSGDLFKAIPFSFAGMFTSIALRQLIIAAAGTIFFIVASLIQIKNLRSIPFSMILALDILITYFIASVLKKPLPSGRVLLPLYPLVGLSLVELILLTLQKIRLNIPKIIGPVFMGIAVLLLGFNYLKDINFYTTHDWSENYRIPLLVYKAMFEHTDMPNIGNPAEEFYIDQIELEIKKGNDYLKKNKTP